MTKDTVIKDITDAVREVNRGNYYFSSSVTAILAENFVKEPGRMPEHLKKTALTEKETGIIKLIAEGHADKEIAGRLGISVNTVRSHTNNAMKKLNIHKQALLVRYAVEKGIV